MKKYISLALILFLAGCSSAKIPAYLQDTKPYSRRFNIAYDRMLDATTKAIEEMGWKVDQAMDASVYDRLQVSEGEETNSLIITDVRETPLFFGTRYAKINIYIRSRNNLSEVEIRYITITSLPMKNYTTYSNDAAVDRIFTRIEEYVNQG